MNKRETLKYLNMILLSMTPGKAPRFDKDKIEGERVKAIQALELAIELVKGDK